MKCHCHFLCAFATCLVAKSTRNEQEKQQIKKKEINLEQWAKGSRQQEEEDGVILKRSLAARQKPAATSFVRVY